MTHTRQNAKANVNASCLKCVAYSCQTDFLQFPSILIANVPSSVCSLLKDCLGSALLPGFTFWHPQSPFSRPNHLLFPVLLSGDLTINIRVSAWLPSHRLQRVTLSCLPYSSQFLDFHGSPAALFIL